MNYIRIVKSLTSNNNDLGDGDKSLSAWLLVIACMLCGISLNGYFIINTLARIRGDYIPKIHEIEYSEGLLRAYYKKFDEDDGDGARDLLVVQMSGQKFTKKPLSNIYYCNYNVIHKPNTSFCLKEDEIVQHNGKPAKIGWYVSKPFLWYDNPYPQLMTLEVDGKSIISYDYMQSELKEMNRSDKVIDFIFLIFITFFMMIFMLIPWNIIYPKQMRRGARWLLRT